LSGCAFLYSSHSSRSVTPFRLEFFLQILKVWQGAAIFERDSLFREQPLIQFLFAHPSGNDQCRFAVWARRMYTPTVLLDILPARAITRLDNPLISLSRSISRILSKDNPSCAISLPPVCWRARMPHFIILQRGSLYADCAACSETLCDMLPNAVRLAPFYTLLPPASKKEASISYSPYL
jgi:hypothetical protein